MVKIEFNANVDLLLSFFPVYNIYGMQENCPEVEENDTELSNAMYVNVITSSF